MNAALTSSDNATKNVQVAREVFEQAMHDHVSARPVLVPHGQQFVPSAIHFIKHNGDLDAVRFAASWVGLLSRQRSMHVFQPGDGDDVLHQLSVPTDSMGHTANLLRNSAIPHFVLEPIGTAHRVHIIDLGGQRTDTIKKIGASLNAQHRTINGTGYGLGSSSGTDASSRKSYRDTITAYEQAAGVSSSAAS